MKPFYIGIDPDCDKSGIAVWHDNEFVSLSTMDLFDLCDTLLKYYHLQHNVIVRLEAGWLISGTWHKGGNGQAKRVGANHEIGRQIEKYCVKHNIPYQLVKPKGYSSYTHETFCAVTGWPKNKKTNPETRVAAMMVYGF